MGQNCGQGVLAEMQAPSSKETFKERLSQRPSDQGQRHREEVRADNLDSGLVRAGRREAPPAACAGLGQAVVPERASEAVDSD